MSISFLVGQAFLGTVCDFDTGYRSSIVEYFYNDDITAEIAVHEFGHG